MSAIETARSVATVFQEEKITFLAASVAFYAFVSIIPLLLISLAIGSLVGGQAFADQIIVLVEGQLSEQGVTVVEQALSGSAGRGTASVVSLVTLTWSAIKVVRGLDLAFDEVYGSEPETSLAQQIINGLIVLGIVGLAVVAMIGLGMLLARPSLVGVPFIGVLGWVGLTVGLFLIFLPFYYVLPPVDVSVKEILPGALVAGVGWLLLQAGFQLYAANAGQYQAYGFLGAVLLFIMWMYFASVLILLGAVVNTVYASQVRDYGGS
ncbi:YihY/virulence factor BrkB family protein [Halanaeroarchaeum sulfurireducens]|uniref:Ribonuclease BN n=1 Tax=Halanaeroarchaeum sulfurireducens TaxID=1604004 RepID=A0A0F7PBJ8_9EURY|nr:YihY/virulence factor BrkB family protein [Halanaeroarchaeum sulfurireducens]AKH97019.1 ribonuclease BN [Halanaeroarchaeum sulfurireducens]ALG81420.1 ribonuclease BN [Halanaeroarchaeum sulfurireducens]